ncbi:unnamed protein product [Paramecium sonneborni]|uniref:Transmembrane protein n=1 Tax=Paramecium sonneborni TaxID=65129 RepID=A0A8S1QKX3_9CILI|nr:unnamed protein product [Paramecium sonneborni]
MSENQESNRDREIREQMKKQYMEEEAKLQQGMEEEESALRDYFKNIQKPLPSDPTIIRRKRYNEKMATYQEVIKDISLKEMVKTIWQYQASTPEENETLYDCKQYFKWRCYEGMGACLAMTSFISFWNRRYLSYTAKGLGVLVGLGTGFAMGFLRSTQYTLQRLEELGQDYYLGRLAINEIEDFRMDKVIKKNI